MSTNEGEESVIVTEEGRQGVLMGEKYSDHPRVLTNQDPPLIWQIYRYTWSLFESHGYIIFLGVIITYFLYYKLLDYLEQKVGRKKSVNGNLNPEEHLSRMEAMRRAREKLQSEVDAQAAKESEKLREKEEKKRKEKIEDWENHKRGMGYKSKTKAQGTSLKADTYNALGGGSAPSCSYRPSRPNFRRGGGGG